MQDGLVDLDEPILRHLTDFTVRSDFEEAPERRITLRHLLTHTAGFTYEAPVGSSHDVGDASFGEHLASIPRTRLRLPVGHHHEYSNLGIDLAGQVVAVACGPPFAEYVRRRLFEPLGLHRSTFDVEVFDAEPDRAVGHSRTFERTRRPVPRRVPMVPSGGLYTGVGDVLRYLQLHLREGEDLLRPELIRQHLDFPRHTDEQTEGYGLGLYVDHWEPGVRVLHHGGAGFGFLCQVFWLPDLGVGGAVLTSSVDHDLPGELAAAIVRRLAMGTGERAPSGVAHPRPPDAAGRYVGRLGDVVEVDAATPPRPGQLFLRDGAGRVRYLLNTRNGDVGYRTSVPGPGSALPAELLGDYVSRVGDVPMSPYRLRQAAEHAVIDLPRGGSLADPAALQVTEVEPGRHLSATGEVLMVGEFEVSYANIQLHRPRRATC